MSSQVSALSNPLIEGSINRAIFRLALPVVASMALHNLFQITDAWWVSRFLGKDATAAIGSGGFVVWGIFSLGMMVSVGVSAMVSRFTGSGDKRMTGEVAYQGLALGMLMSFVVMAIGLGGRAWVFRFLDTDPNVTELARIYLQVLFWGVSAQILFNIITSIFRSMGDAVTPLVLLVFAVMLNLVLAPWMMLGLWPFPKMGVAGTAIATVFSQSLGVVLGLRILILKRGDRIDWKLPSWRPNFAMYWRILKIGLPTSLSGVFFSLVYFCLLRVIAEISEESKTASLAALTLGFRVESLSFMWSIGFSVAAGTLVGQNLGAGKPERAERCAWRATGILSLIAGTAGLLMMLLPRYLVGFFTDDPEVIAQAASYIWIMGLIQVPQAMASVLRGAFNGAGNTLPTLIVEGPLNVARVPLAYVLGITCGWGIQGVWWAIGLSCLSKGVCMSSWFSLGKWKQYQVWPSRTSAQTEQAVLELAEVEDIER